MAMQMRDSKNTKSEKNFPGFGSAIRQEFIMTPDFVHLNHGSYGKSPKVVQESLHEFQRMAESQPDVWFRLKVKGQLEDARQQLSQLLNAPKEDLVFIQNATSGMNAIFRSLKLVPGDHILYFNTTYAAMQCLIQFVCDQSEGKIKPLKFHVNYPMSNSQLVENLSQFLEQSTKWATTSSSSPFRIRLALIDHISSTPAVKLPIEQIIPMLRARYPDTVVIIDGAHAVGQVPIDLEALKPDVYITNCHKWLFAARSCALMYVDKKLQGEIHPSNISYNYKQPTNFQDEFFWTGTMDYSSYLTINAALEFRRQVGGESAIREHNHQLILKGGQYLKERFGTQILQSGEEQVGSMIDVQIPIHLDNVHDERLTEDFWLTTTLDKFRVATFPHKHDKHWWIRVSAQIYTEFKDFEELAEAILSICRDINAQKFS